jgi:hypothetical protein
VKALAGKATLRLLVGNASADVTGPHEKTFSRSQSFPKPPANCPSIERGIMSHNLKSDLALFAAAFVAAVLVPGANSSFAQLLDAIVGAR